MTRLVRVERPDAASLPERVAPNDRLEDVYAAALRRPPDHEAREMAERGFADGTLTPSALLVQLVASEEFARLHAIEAGVALARRARRTGAPIELTAPPGVDERAIEIAWVLARYRGEPRVLDVGSANAERAYLEALLELAPGVVGVDLVAASIPGLDLRVGDLRRLSFPSRSFDAVLCISTLEHVGCSQERYGLNAEQDAGGILAALREIERLLADDGYALITVPCGREEDHGWFVQHDRPGWNRLVAAAGLIVSEQELYELGRAGWRLGHDDQSAYGERGPAASAVLCSELRRPRRPLARIAQAGRLSSSLGRNGRTDGLTR
jgi:SAM-dependent methyltransferase